MNALVQAFSNEENQAFTENGMPAFNSTNDYLVDFFYNAPSGRRIKALVKYNGYAMAHAQDPTAALRLLFWLRDIRGGSGERNTFRAIIHFAAIYGRFKSEHIPLIPEYGRYDDIISLMNTPLEDAALDFASERLKAKDPLCAKWMPRTRGRFRPFAFKLARKMGISLSVYSKLLKQLTDVVEQKMTARQWDKIDYTEVPSVAGARYMGAFYRHDKTRYTEFLHNGGINSKDLFPHDVIRLLNTGNSKSEVFSDILWDSLPNTLLKNEQNIMPMIDVSGSMYTPVSGSVQAIDVSTSLGIYLSQNMNGAFKNMFMTFAQTPRIIKLSSPSFSNNVQQVRKHMGYNTNIELAFAELLRIATQSNVPKNDMPEKILILSDMQFDSAVIHEGMGFMDMVEKQYREAGYDLPKIVFWNLCNRDVGTIHGGADDDRIILVGGFSPSVMNFALNDKKLEEVEFTDAIDGELVTKKKMVKVDKTPEEIVQDVVTSDRYASINW